MNTHAEARHHAEQAEAMIQKSLNADRPIQERNK
jgi:hypothetical protein